MGGVLSLAHSEKQDTTAPRKKTFGHRPLVAFADHGQAGSGEPVTALLRPRNAGSNTAADHIETAREQLSRVVDHGAVPARINRSYGISGAGRLSPRSRFGERLLGCLR